MNKVSIMIVEDEHLIAIDIKKNLENMGYQVASISARASEALEHLKEEKAPDLVLMDIYLSGEMDGIAAASEIHDHYAIPVIFLTAFAESDVVERAREVGAYGYLMKPVGKRELRAMIEIALYKHKTEQDRQQLDECIQRAQKFESLRVMAGGIAHMFNNALHAVLGNLELASMNLPPESPVKYNLREAEKAARKAAELSAQIHVCSGHGFVEHEKLDLTAFVEQVKHLIEAFLPSSVILSLDLASGLPGVMADPAQLRQALFALIWNGVEAIDGNSGIVTIRTSVVECDKDSLSEFQVNGVLEQGQYVFMEVGDTGCGMDRKTALNMFDPFFSTKFTGRGLGLAALLGIVQIHRGGVKVNSEPGKGTSVRVLLPVSKADRSEVKRQSQEIPDWRGSGTVLLVDDEEAVRALGRAMLERVGFSVLTAVDGLEAIDIFNRHSSEVVCVLLDLTMPRKNGRDAFLAIRRIHPNAKVILSSGYAEEDAMHRFSERGLAGFIQKPYQFSSLATTLRRVLEIK